MQSLPRVAKGEHHMRTARALIWGRKNQTTTSTDDEQRTLSDGRF